MTTGIFHKKIHHLANFCENGILFLLWLTICSNIQTLMKVENHNDFIFLSTRNIPNLSYQKLLSIVNFRHLGRHGNRNVPPMYAKCESIN